MIRSQPLDAPRELAGSGEADQHLLRAFLEGNPDAFDRLFLKYQDYVYNICLGILGNPDDARDCAQETFLRVYHKARDFRGHSALSTWIYRIAVNICVGTLRRRPKAGLASLDDEQVREVADDGPPPTAGLERQEEEERIRALVAELPPDYRLVLVLRYFQGLSYDEMVRVLGWTMPQVKVKLYRARRAFAARFHEEK